MDVWKGSYVMETQNIVQIRCWVSTSTMIPKTREEKVLHRGGVEMVQHRRSKKDYADPFLGIKYQNDSYNKRGEVPTPWMCEKGLTPWKQ